MVSMKESRADRNLPPHDARAEAEAVGHAVATAEGAELVFARLDPGDLYDHRHRRILEACRLVADVGRRFTAPMTDDDARELWPMTRPLSEHVRIGAISVVADVHVSEVRRLVEGRSTFADTAAQYPPRVATAARRRHAIALAAEVREALEAGEPAAGLVAALAEVAA